MRSLNLHLKVLTGLLASLGLGITLYQILVLGIPLREDETDDLWNIDTRIEFVATGKGPVKVQMYVPPLNQNFASLNESFISNSYGVSVSRNEGNRRVTWSARRARGQQTLYYRLTMTRRYHGSSEPLSPASGPVFREAVPLRGVEKAAAEALVQPARQHSADVETLISEVIRLTSNTADENVRLLLNGDTSTSNRVNIIETLLSLAHVPIERVFTLRLASGQPQQVPELWIRSFNGRNWLYFNPLSGEQGLPADRLVWWHGDHPLLGIEGGKEASVRFTLNNSEINAIRLAQLTDQNSNARFFEYSLYGLPLETQQTYQIMIMIPVGVLLILILRNVIGIQTLGTFTPVLIAMAFRETRLLSGILLFSLITAMGLSLRSYLEHLKLQMLPRLSVVLTFVVILIAAISLLSHKLGLESGLSVSLFPMVILTMTIERLSVTWEERGGSQAFRIALGTLFSGSLAYLLMNIPPLVYFIFTFPGTLLVMVSLMLALGRYRGYRLTELLRFKALVKE